LPISRLIAIALVALPIAEIATFIVVGKAIGVLATLLLVVASAIGGLALLRGQGIALLLRARRDAAAGLLPAEAAGEGLLLVGAGVLLLIPGFLTDLAAFALLIPGLRRAAWRGLRGRTPSGPDSWARREAGRRPDVIELAPEDYSAPSRPTPWARGGDAG